MVHYYSYSILNDITKFHLSDQSRLTLYADDILLYKPITQSTSQVEIHQDINRLFQWSQENMLSFNITKCKCMLLTKKRNTSLATIFLNNQPLEYVCHYKYLGVILASNLSWSNHIQEICKKTRRVLGMIYHRISKNIDDPSTILKLYTALVRPHLEYAVQVWNPYQEKDIQKFALRMCAKDYHASYQDLLELFCISSLRNKRFYLSLCTFHCIVNGLVYFPQLNAVHPPMSSSRNYSPHAYLVPYAHCNTNSRFSVLLSDYGIVSPSKLILLNIYKSLNITYHLFSSLPNCYLFVLNYLLGTLHLLATAIIVYQEPRFCRVYLCKSTRT